MRETRGEITKSDRSTTSFNAELKRRCLENQRFLRASQKIYEHTIALHCISLNSLKENDLKALIQAPKIAESAILLSYEVNLCPLKNEGQIADWSRRTKASSRAQPLRGRVSRAHETPMAGN